MTSKYSLDSFASSSLTFSSTSSTTNTRAVMVRTGCVVRLGQETFDGAQKAYHRNRLGDVGLAPALADLFLVALHRESSHCDHWDRAQTVVLLDPLGDLE